MVLRLASPIFPTSAEPENSAAHKFARPRAAAVILAPGQSNCFQLEWRVARPIWNLHKIDRQREPAAAYQQLRRLLSGVVSRWRSGGLRSLFRKGVYDLYSSRARWARAQAICRTTGPAIWRFGLVSEWKIHSLLRLASVATFLQHLYSRRR